MKSLFSALTLTALSLQPVAAAGLPAGDEPNLVLMPGFKYQVFAEGVGKARHLAVRPNGDVYVRLEAPHKGKSLVALRDSDRDGKAETISYFGDDKAGSGLTLDENYLYFSDAESVYRQGWSGNELVPVTRPERLVKNLGTEGMHLARSLTLDGQNGLYVNVGAPSNSCQAVDRAPESMGQEPCPQLEAHAAVWRFDKGRLEQDKLSDGERYASGVRNAVALEWHTGLNRLFLLQHGRDQLHESFPKLYNARQGAELPAEEFSEIVRGNNLGWPYCYFDGEKQQKLLAPEYGGDGTQVGRCSGFKAPLAALPAHYAPNDLIFYSGSQFPKRFQHGAFMAFHGSWNRGSQQEGFQVVFMPLNQGKPGPWSVFADNFAGKTLVSNADAGNYRPVGLAQMPDGSLLVADSKQGRIWKISYAGDEPEIWKQLLN